MPLSHRAASAAVLFSMLFGSTWYPTSALNSSLGSALGMIREAYTTNSICAKKNCINPVFPGMEDLHRLNQAKWICSSLQRTSQHMGFCKAAISYDPSLPMPTGGSVKVRELVQRQDNAASTMFYYHLSGLGMEAWDYQDPENADDCVKSIWRMVCFTYFPRATVGCQEGAFTTYMRPCQSSCFNYIRQCGVECCDESVQCVFEHKKAISGNAIVKTQGYLPHDGPSSLCTGAATRSAKLGLVFWMMVALVMALSMQGCSTEVPVHKVGNWRGTPDYLIQHQYIPPGAPANQATLNSCALPNLSQSAQCSGNGVCKLWDPANVHNDLSFCLCDKKWADPECRTRRRSQTIAYLYALFFGVFGADQFYLGFFTKGLLKLCTFGGCGVWWAMDVIAIGSAPVYTPTYRVAHDLPHYVFVLSATMVGMLVGFGIAAGLTILFRVKKQRLAMMLNMDEDKRQWDAIKPQRGMGQQFIPYGSIPAAMDPMRPLAPIPMSGSMMI